MNTIGLLDKGIDFRFTYTITIHRLSKQSNINRILVPDLHTYVYNKLVTFLVKSQTPDICLIIFHFSFRLLNSNQIKQLPRNLFRNISLKEAL